MSKNNTHDNPNEVGTTSTHASESVVDDSLNAKKNRSNRSNVSRKKNSFSAMTFMKDYLVSSYNVLFSLACEEQPSYVDIVKGTVAMKNLETAYANLLILLNNNDKGKLNTITSILDKSSLSFGNGITMNASGNSLTVILDTKNRIDDSVSVEERVSKILFGDRVSLEEEENDLIDALILGALLHHHKFYLKNVSFILSPSDYKSILDSRKRSGLFIVYGEARSGKTRFLTKTLPHYISMDEPTFNSLDSNLVIPLIKTVALLRIWYDSVNENSWVLGIDSLRELMYKSVGNTLPQGVNSGFFYMLRELSTMASAASMTLLGTLNPMETKGSSLKGTEVFEKPGLARAIVGSCTGLVSNLSHEADDVIGDAVLRFENGRNIMQIKASDYLFSPTARIDERKFSGYQEPLILSGSSETSSIEQESGDFTFNFSLDSSNGSIDDSFNFIDKSTFDENGSANTGLNNAYF